MDRQNKSKKHRWSIRSWLTVPLWCWNPVALFSAEAHRGRHLLRLRRGVHGLRVVVRGLLPDGQNSCHSRRRPGNGENLPHSLTLRNSHFLELTDGCRPPRVKQRVCPTRSRSCVSVSWPGSIRPYSEPTPSCRNRKEASWMLKWKRRYKRAPAHHILPFKLLSSLVRNLEMLSFGYSRKIPTVNAIHIPQMLFVFFDERS